MQYDKTIELVHPLKEEHILHLPQYFELRKPIKIHKREEYGFEDDDIVVITVGNRLQRDISKSLAAQMSLLLASKKNLKWLIVGCAEIDYISKHHENLVGKSIIFIRYETDLPGLYKVCDVYLNPERVGGGATTAWAIQQGLAIVSPSTAVDGTTIIGKGNSQPTEADLTCFIERLINDDKLLRREKDKFLGIAAGWRFDNYISELIYGMNVLVENFTNGMV